MNEPDIRDIRLPPPDPLRDFVAAHWPWLAAGAALLPLLLAALFLWRRRAARRAVPPLPQATLAELERTRPLLQAGDAQGFVVRVSDIIRRYIERRFQVRALQRTSLEFLLACLADPGSPLAPYRAELGQFMQACDLAKFAGWSPSGAEMEALLDSARAFVQRTGRQAAAGTD